MQRFGHHCHSEQEKGAPAQHLAFAFGEFIDELAPALHDMAETKPSDEGRNEPVTADL